MRILSLLSGVLSLSCLAWASPTDIGAGLTQRPGSPGHGHRKVVTIRSSRNDTDDVSVEFLKGIQKANHGGTLKLKKNETYIIGKKLDLTFLNDVEVNIEGTLKFTNDINYWQNNYFYYPFQKSITFWRWGGKDIKIYGSGTIDGNGQAWYDGFAGFEILDPSNTYLRPILFLTENATRISVDGITFLNSPCWTTFMVRTKDVSFNNVDIIAYSTNASSLPKNTDGFDTYNVDGISVTNTRVNVGDDCFSPKPNTSSIYVKDLWCNGTHGVSMGSIGQYAGTLDYIKDVYIENVTMLNGQNGARLKAWAGPNVGYGYISNVTFTDFYIENTDAPIVLDQCYFNVNATTCAAYPSNVNITDITFQHFRGSSSGKKGDVVASLKCSPAAVCSNITLEDIELTTPSGEEGEIVCSNIQGDIGVPCNSTTTG